MIKTVTRDAFAKINLGLDVTGLREDGYHLLRMIMQQIDLHDTLTFTVKEPADPGSGGAIVLCDESGLTPAGGDNLICRAVRMMKETYDLCADVEIRLTKRIPMAAGLATMRELNAHPEYYKHAEAMTARLLDGLKDY